MAKASSIIWIINSTLLVLFLEDFMDGMEPNGSLGRISRRWRHALWCCSTTVEITRQLQPKELLLCPEHVAMVLVVGVNFFLDRYWKNYLNWILLGVFLFYLRLLLWQLIVPKLTEATTVLCCELCSILFPRLFQSHVEIDTNLKKKLREVDKKRTTEVRKRTQYTHFFNSEEPSNMELSRDHRKKSSFSCELNFLTAKLEVI